MKKHRYALLGLSTLTVGYTGNRIHDYYVEYERHNKYRRPKFGQINNDDIIKLPNHVYVNASGLSEADVFTVLYNYACPFGLGLTHYKSTMMTPDQAAMIFVECEGRKQFYLGTVNERPIHADFEHFPILTANEYDRLNGTGAMQRCINTLKTQ